MWQRRVGGPFLCVSGSDLACWYEFVTLLRKARVWFVCGDGIGSVGTTEVDLSGAVGRRAFGGGRFLAPWKSVLEHVEVSVNNALE